MMNYRNMGIGAFNQGGSVPRQTMIEDQPHMLAYINPQEEMMLRRMGGTGQPGPGGVPAYPPQSVNERDQYDRMEVVRNNLIDATNQNADDDVVVNPKAIQAVQKAQAIANQENQKRKAERARQIAFMDNPSFIVNDDRLLRRGTLRLAHRHLPHPRDYAARDSGQLDDPWLSSYQRVRP